MDIRNSMTRKEISLEHRGTPAPENKWLISLVSFSYFALCLPVFLRGPSLRGKPRGWGREETVGIVAMIAKANLAQGNK